MKTLKNKSIGVRMVAATNDVKYNEQRLADKAQRIIDLNQELRKLEQKIQELKVQKPTCNKEKLSYKESLIYGKKMNQYQQKMKTLDVQKMKLERQLTAVELQAKKLVPVCGIKIKVSKYSTDGEPIQTYCIEQVAVDENQGSKRCINIEKLN